MSLNLGIPGMASSPKYTGEDYPQGGLTLGLGEWWQQGAAVLIMTPGHAVVLFKVDIGHPPGPGGVYRHDQVWSNGGEFTDCQFLAFQPDGNLVVYEYRDGQPYARSTTDTQIRLCAKAARRLASKPPSSNAAFALTIITAFTGRRFADLAASSISA